jgi:hypothetical protein
MNNKIDSNKMHDNLNNHLYNDLFNKDTYKLIIMDMISISLLTELHELESQIKQICNEDKSNT